MPSTRIFWKSRRPGEDEQFDADRFLVWLEILLEGGEALVAAKLAEMPEDLVTLALHRHLLVLDVEQLALDMQASDEVDARQLDKALESCLYEEIDGFQLMARTPDGWDAILSVVLALDRDHHEFLQRVLEHCCAMSAEYIEDNGGLYEVLSSDEMLEADVAGDREERRAEAGHVVPSSAAAFLKLARSKPATLEAERDPLTRAYFRDLRPVSKRAATASAPASAPARLDSVTRAGGLAEVLKEAGIVVEVAPRRWLGPGGKASAPAEGLLVEAMRALAEESPGAFHERSEELAYLTNVLLVGCTFQGRRFRPIEAVRAALALCNLGLCLCLPATASRRPKAGSKEALAILTRTPADVLFRAGWHRAQADVVDAASSVVRALLAEVAAEEANEHRVACKRALTILEKACRENAPWKALTAVDALLGVLDGPNVDGLRGLMDPCPRLPDVLEPNAAPHEKTDGRRLVRFVSTPACLEAARRFLGELHRPTTD